MSWRRQLPAYSPLPLRAVMAGLQGLVAGPGAAAQRLEAVLARHFGAQAVVLTDSGTGALALAIRVALEERPGAPVALPAYGCYDIATAADGASAPVLLYDVDPATLEPDRASLKNCLHRGARAVVIAHLFGIPVDADPVRGAIGGSGAWLIEDAAQGAGATLRGRPLGAFGDLAVLSFGRGKGITGGRGGALLGFGPRGVAAATRARSFMRARRRGLKEAVLLTAQWLFGRPALYAVPAAVPFLKLGETVYQPPPPVHAMSAAAARALGVTWRLGPREAEIRRDAAGGTSNIQATPQAVPGYLRVPIVASAAQRSRAGDAHARALGIMPGYPAALCDLAGFGGRALNGGERFVGARLLAERLITVPAHSKLTARDRARLKAWVTPEVS